MIRLRENSNAQSLFEFAVVVPIVLLLFFGIIELGRYVLLYSTVTLAVRDGARYGSAAEKYKDCAGIRSAVLNTGDLAGLDASDVSIHYEEHQSGAIIYATCADLAATPDDGIEFGDRVVVQASISIQPMVANLPALNIISRVEKSIAINMVLVGE